MKLATSSNALPERLRLETRALHAATERSGAMAALLAGRLPRPVYVQMVRNLHALYEALETALQVHGAAEAVAVLQAAPLARAPALAEDLALLHGPGWAEALPLAATTQHYVARLQALARAAPSEAAPPLVAHAYVRYLGDLHGGQALARVVARAYALPGAAGTDFYRFGTEVELPQRRAALRAALAALPLTAPEADAFVAEACWGFEQHVRLFEELAAA